MNPIERIIWEFMRAGGSPLRNKNRACVLVCAGSLAAEADASLHQRLSGWILVKMKLFRKGMEKSHRTVGAGSPEASLGSSQTRALRQELSNKTNMGVML